MALSIFDDRASVPTQADLDEALGRSSRVWTLLRTRFAAQYAPLAEEWKFYGRKYGWSLQLKHRRRTILYLIPQRKHFLAAFALGERAVRVARRSDLSDTIRSAIKDAQKYPEGRGVRVPVRTRKDAAEIETLAAIKMAK